MRIMTLSEMVDELRGEAGISQNVAHGANYNTAYKQLIRRVQEELILAYDWPHLRIVATDPVAADTRYAAYPDNVRLDGIHRVFARAADSTTWCQLTYGIGIDQLNDVDSDAAETATKIERWAHRMEPTGNTNNNMYEVWPIPSIDHVLRFEAKREPLNDLTNDNDESTIDGPSIVLFAAAELLARDKAEDAGLKLDAGKRRVTTILNRMAGADNRAVNMAASLQPSGPTGPRYPD